MAEKKILIVEDNEIVALETSERLKRLWYIVTGEPGKGARFEMTVHKKGVWRMTGKGA